MLALGEKEYPENEYLKIASDNNYCRLLDLSEVLYGTF